MADFLEEQKKQSLFQQVQKEKEVSQGNVTQQRMAEVMGQTSYVSETEKTKDKAFYSVDNRAEELIDKVRNKALTHSEQKEILEEDRKFRTKAGIRL